MVGLLYTGGTYRGAGATFFTTGFRIGFFTFLGGLETFLAQHSHLHSHAVTGATTGADAAGAGGNGVTTAEAGMTGVTTAFTLCGVIGLTAPQKRKYIPKASTARMAAIAAYFFHGVAFAP